MDCVSNATWMRFEPSQKRSFVFKQLILNLLRVWLKSSFMTDADTNVIFSFKLDHSHHTMTVLIYPDFVC